MTANDELADIGVDTHELESAEKTFYEDYWTPWKCRLSEEVHEEYET